MKVYAIIRSEDDSLHYVRVTYMADDQRVRRMLSCGFNNQVDAVEVIERMLEE